VARLEAASFWRARSALGPSSAQELGVSLVRSPLAGTVVERRVVTGQSVKGERIVFVVANLDRLLLEVQVDAREARALRVGDRVELERDAAASPIPGEVAQLGDGGDASSGRALVVRVGVDNRARQLRPGQAVSAKIFASTGARALVIPKRAVAWIAGRPAVFVERGHNSLQASSVMLGSGNGELTEVSAGLAAGQRIVSEGVSVLKDESFL
jgi:RND family efflux transporter MFP subunit